MTTITLDQIIRNYLLRRGYTLHHYLESLVYAKDCLRELSFDDLHIINTKLLTVNTDDNTVPLPEDYVDFCLVGVQVGQNVRPLVLNEKINRLRNYDDDFNAEFFNNPPTNSTNPIYYNYLYSYYWNLSTFNEYGEFTGRLYGYQGIYTDTYNIIPERNEIQLNQHLVVDEIVLQYISNGLDATSVSKITPYAQATIEAYITWQHKQCSRHYNNQDRQMAEMEYIKQRKILRARMNTLTIQEVKRILYKSSVATPK